MATLIQYRDNISHIFTLIMRWHISMSILHTPIYKSVDIPYNVITFISDMTHQWCAHEWGRRPGHGNPLHRQSGWGEAEGGNSVVGCCTFSPFFCLHLIKDLNVSFYKCTPECTTSSLGRIRPTSWDFMEDPPPPSPTSLTVEGFFLSSCFMNRKEFVMRLMR